jgi:hypothetical protein
MHSAETADRTKKNAGCAAAPIRESVNELLSSKVKIGLIECAWGPQGWDLLAAAAGPTPLGVAPKRDRRSFLPAHHAASAPTKGPLDVLERITCVADHSPSRRYRDIALVQYWPPVALQ